ncbi:MAG: hypothetical protein NC416_16950, partial [Eubacterium sp.]|nr:hypothetical protein [Eubacterium sp.]
MEVLNKGGLCHMKLITANKLNRLWKNGILPELQKRIEKTRVLKSLEEIAANTNAENLAGAAAVNELNNKLNGCSLEQDGEDFYIVGADSVRKKLGSGTISGYIFLMQNSNQAYRTSI